MRKLIAAFLVVAMLALPVSAGNRIVVIQTNGDAWVTEDGKTIVIPRDHVVYPPDFTAPDPGPEDPDNPDPEDPDPPTTSYLEEVERTATEIDDPVSALILAEAMYSTLADRIADGTIPADPDSVDLAMTKAKQVVNRGEVWDDWHRSVVIPELGRRVISGETKTKAEYVLFFRETEGGLKKSADNAAVPTWLAPLIAALVEALIQLLQDVFGTQTSAVEVPDLDTISASELSEYLRGLADG